MAPRVGGSGLFGYEYFPKGEEGYRKLVLERRTVPRERTTAPVTKLVLCGKQESSRQVAAIGKEIRA